MEVDEALKNDLFRLVGFLLSSAHGLYDEPASYGPFRLMDAAGRLLEVMRAHGLVDAFLQELEKDLDKQRFGAMNNQDTHAILNELVIRYMVELKERIEEAES
jgi:hypothetical protein